MAQQDNDSGVNRIFALIIGINEYSHVSGLSGCVADGQDAHKYLNEIGVDDSRIVVLYDEKAKRNDIINALKGLQTDERIEHGDPIVIFYAGHGSETDTPPGWIAGARKIQTMVPQDCQARVDGKRIPAIPDRTLGFLLTRLAKAKGDNISVIFDCCHSASGTRKLLPGSPDPVSADDPDAVPRRCKIDPIPATIDEDIYADGGVGRADTIASEDLLYGLRSHTLLAACGEKETSKEQYGRGRFSLALFKLLREKGWESFTYAEVVDRLPLFPDQTPHCEGANQDRQLFNAKESRPRRLRYAIFEDKGVYKIRAGEASEVTEGAEFDVYPDGTSNEQLGVVTVSGTNPRPYTSELNTPSFTIPAEAHAQLIKYGIRDGLRLRNDVSEEAAEKFPKLTKLLNPFDRQLGVVDRETPNLTLSDSPEGLRFEMAQELTYPHVPPLLLSPPFRFIHAMKDDDLIEPVLRTAHQFFSNLLRTPKQKSLGTRVDVQLQELADTEDYDENFNVVRKPVGENLIQDGAIDIIPKDGTVYGVTLENKSSKDLYVSAYYFDTTDISAHTWFEPPRAAQDTQTTPDPPLKANQKLAIGYGSSGTPARSFSVRGGHEYEIGFIKIFITTEYVDFSSVKQDSPFDGGPRVDRAEPPLPLWDTIVIKHKTRVA